MRKTVVFQKGSKSRKGELRKSHGRAAAAFDTPTKKKFSFSLNCKEQNSWKHRHSCSSIAFSLNCKEQNSKFIVVVLNHRSQNGIGADHIGLKSGRSGEKEKRPNETGLHGIWAFL
jgi:hypothetical protein